MNVKHIGGFAMERKPKMHREDDFDLDNMYNDEQNYGASRQNIGWET